MMRRFQTLILLAATAAFAGPSITSQSNRGVQIKLSAPQGTNLLQSYAKANLAELFSDAYMIGEPGGPALPRYRMVVGLPPEGDVKISYTLGTSRELKGVIPENYEIPGIGTGANSFPQWADTLKPVYYHVTTWRDFRVAVIEVTPLKYSSGNQTLVLYDGVTLNISFEPYEGYHDISNDQFSEIYKNSIINYDQCMGWKLSSSTFAAGANPFAQSSNWVKISIPEDGVYRIGVGDLKKIGVDPTQIDPSTIRILYPSRLTPEDTFPDTLSELPCFVQGEDDGRLSGVDYIILFAQGANHWNFSERTFEVNPYVKENVYWLTWGAGKGKRLQTRPAYPSQDTPLTEGMSVLHFEEDHECPSRSGLLWLWEDIQKSSTIASDTFILDLEGVTKIDTFTLQAYSINTGAGFRALANTDTLLYVPLVPSGVIANPRYTTIDPDVVLQDELPLVIEVTGEGQQDFYPDWMRLVVERELSFDQNPYWVELKGNLSYRFSGLKTTPYLFDVSDPANPILLTNWETKNGNLFLNPRITKDLPLWVADERRLKTPALEKEQPGELWTEDWSVDYIILSTDENMSAAKAYESYRSQNLKISGVSATAIKTVNLKDIIRDFGFGLAEPQAVRHFLSYAYKKGDSRPRYALILGDGTYDYKNNLKLTVPEYFLVHTQDYLLDPNVTEVRGPALDSWFVDFDNPVTYHPEMSIARITARDAHEASDILDKIKKYESTPKEAWASRLLLLSDDYYEGSPAKEDGIDNHISACESFATLLYPEYDPVKVYLSDYSFVGSTKPGAHDALISALDQGAYLWLFFGHGNGSQLTHEAVFRNTDVTYVNNENRLPFGLFCSCGVGRFEDTRWECIAEELVRGSGGAIATIAATKGTSASNNQNVANTLANTFRYLKNANTGDLLFAVLPLDPLYTLFGDPGVELLFPTAKNVTSIPPDFVTGDTAQITFDAGLSQGKWFASAYGSWVKKIPQVYDYRIYYAKGEPLYEASGELDAGQTILKFIVPTGIAEGDSAYWYISCRDEDSLYTFRFDSLGVVAGSTSSSDHKGPSARFYVAGEEIFDGDTIPTPSFDLEIELEDPSGINLTGLPGVGLGGGHPLSLVINDEDAISLSSYFSYDVTDSSIASTGMASLPIKFSKEDNALTLYAVDNLRNTTKYELTLHTSFVSRPEIITPLVYPNPVSSSADFTFELNTAAEVSIQIFTVSGRLVRKLPAQSFAAGFSSYSWNGLDADGTPLPNGVYIYRLTAKSLDATMTETMTSVNEKFIIVH